MNHKTIEKLQKEYGAKQLQDSINNGTVWKLEGSFGRRAMYALETGECMLPKTWQLDYYNNIVPSRDKLKSGTKGTYQNCKEFWRKVQEGEIFYEN